MPHALLLWIQESARGEIGGVPFLQSWGAGLALLLSFLALAGVLVGYGRWIEKLNGMGKRVAELEKENQTAITERANFTRTLERVEGALTQLNKEIGKHEKSTEACRDDTEKLGIALGIDIDKLTRTVHEMDKHLSIEIATVQTILKERGIGQ